MGKISVFLSDWQVLFREGIHFTLSGEEDIEVIGEAADNEEALAFIEANSPNVAVLNIAQAEVSGIEVARRIRQNLPSVSVILMAENGGDEDQLFLAMKSGARAYLSKDVDPDVLVAIVKMVAQGLVPISEALLRPGIASRIIDEFGALSVMSERVQNMLACLSPREVEILRQIAGGSQPVVPAPGISEGVIRQQLDFIRTKLVANDHNLRLIEAVRNGLLSMSPEAGLAGKSGVEYVTKDEFSEFRESLMQRFRRLSPE